MAQEDKEVTLSILDEDDESEWSPPKGDLVNHPGHYFERNGTPHKRGKDGELASQRQTRWLANQVHPRREEFLEMYGSKATTEEISKRFNLRGGANDIRLLSLMYDLPSRRRKAAPNELEARVAILEQEVKDLWARVLG